ncbi:TVP38/TMEM64 family protein [bacterium]|nr:TVP38/TMEM64 family protein [bacterium]
MFTTKRGLFWLTVAATFTTVVAMHTLGGIDQVKLQEQLEDAGVWAPIIYIIAYTIATLLMMPSTPLNLTGGALFGTWLGTLWTSIAAIIAAVIAFGFSRTVGRSKIAHWLTGRGQRMDLELKKGGLFYIFAIRLLPILPYGLVNYTSGLTSVSFRDYAIGTALGTVPGVLPFVLLGNSGLQAVRTGDVVPLLIAMGAIGTLVLVATWYRNSQRFPDEFSSSSHNQNFSKDDDSHI